MVIDIVFISAGLVASVGGIFIRVFVGEELEAQNIVTPGDASMPYAQVNDIPTALSISDIIRVHAARITDGLTYAEMGRFAVPDGDPAGTSNADEV